MKILLKLKKKIRVKETRFPLPLFFSKVANKYRVMTWDYKLD